MSNWPVLAETCAYYCLCCVGIGLKSTQWTVKTTASLRHCGWPLLSVVNKHCDWRDCSLIVPSSICDPTTGGPRSQRTEVSCSVTLVDGSVVNARLVCSECTCKTMNELEMYQMCPNCVSVWLLLKHKESFHSSEVHLILTLMVLIVCLCFISNRKCWGVFFITYTHPS